MKKTPNPKSQIPNKLQAPNSKGRFGREDVLGTIRHRRRSAGVSPARASVVTAGETPALQLGVTDKLRPEVSRVGARCLEICGLEFVWDLRFGIWVFPATA